MGVVISPQLLVSLLDGEDHRDPLRCSVWEAFCCQNEVSSYFERSNWKHMHTYYTYILYWHCNRSHNPIHKDILEGGLDPPESSFGRVNSKSRTRYSLTPALQYAPESTFNPDRVCVNTTIQDPNYPHVLGGWIRYSASEDGLPIQNKDSLHLSSVSLLPYSEPRTLHHSAKNTFCPILVSKSIVHEVHSKFNYNHTHFLGHTLF
jgi:hypothetical protein